MPKSSKRDHTSCFMFHPSSEAGFTIIELMVVVAIMAILATVLVLNLAGQRAKRDVQVAENQLVTNIRGIQSNTLSARTLPGGQAAQYYVMKFDLSKPQQYTIEAIYNVGTSPQMTDIQTVALPPDVFIATVTPGSYPLAITRQNSPSPLNLPDASYGNCALLAFKAPFGDTLMNAGCSPAAPALPYTLQKNDDYSNIVYFTQNQQCQTNETPQGCNTSVDSTLNIILSDTGETYSKTVTVNGVTGSVSFN